MQEPQRSVAAAGNSAAVASGIVSLAAIAAVGTTWVLGVSDKETCSEAFGVTEFDGRSLTVCNWVGWFSAIEVLATVVVLLVSLRDIRRHATLQRVPLYIVLFALAIACYVVPSISLGFR